MPIPEWNSNTAEQPQTYLVPVPTASYLPYSLRTRFTAHFFDLFVIHGFSLYVAKICTAFLLAAHVAQVKAVGIGSRSLARQLFQFSHDKLFFVSFFVIAGLYFVAIPYFCGRTPGQGLLGLKILPENGKLKISQLFVRFSWYFLSLCFFGIPFFRVTGFRFPHDIISETIVVRE